jgi:hypothetical protein
MKITLIYKNEPVTLKVPETLAGLHRQRLLSSADIVRECKKAYVSHMELNGKRIDIREIKGTLIK